MPAEAVEAWQGPPPGETDARRWILAHAILAPNPHNMQPWLADLREPDVIDIRVDLDRLLPETDPFGRQVLIGHGCFLELARIAASARGLAAEIGHFPDGPMTPQALSTRRVARIRLRDDGAVRDPLFAHVLARRSNKGRYDTDLPVRAEHLAGLAQAALMSAATLELESDPTRVAHLRELAKRAMLTEIGTPRTLAESVARTRIGADEIAAHRDGIDLNGPMFWLLRNAGLMTPEKATTPGTFAHQGAIDYAMGYMDTSMAYGWLATDGNDREAQLDAGRAYLRLNLAATAMGLGMHPQSQLLQEFPEMAELQREFLAFVGAPASQHVQMLFRMGYAPAPGPSPRRVLGDIISS
jgi:nitroreductase